MRIFIVHSNWIGGLMKYISNAFKSTGNSVFEIGYERKRSPLKHLKIHNIVQIKLWLEKKSWQEFNQKVRWKFEETKLDMFIVMNEGYLLPDTIKYIQNNHCKTVCFIADNPFDSRRYTYLPISLQYFDIILVADKIWIPSIKNVAPHSKVIKITSGGGFNKNLFFPTDETKISESDRTKLGCDISFTGESYSMQAEGAYRAGILDQLGNYDLKIWGDERWKLRFPYYDNLEKAYQGGRLSFDELRKLYQLSAINLNMPSPQVFTGFQPRVFEIAACKGFQIVDWREELDEYFTEDELVTFKNIPELIEKIEYFVKYSEKRKPYVEKLYKKIIDNYPWEKRVQEIIEIISQS